MESRVDGLVGIRNVGGFHPVSLLLLPPPPPEVICCKRLVRENAYKAQGKNYNGQGRDQRAMTKIDTYFHEYEE